MTKAQITAVLAELNISFAGMYTPDTWLEMHQVSEIILYIDECVYPDLTMQVYFDNTHDVLRLRTGTYNEALTVFTPKRETAIIDYNLVVGFIMAKQSTLKSPYRYASTL